MAAFGHEHVNPWSGASMKMDPAPTMSLVTNAI